MNAIETLRGTVADCQDVLSAPDVDRAIAALATLETLLQTAEPFVAYEEWATAKGVKGRPPALGPNQIRALAAAVRDAKGHTTQSSGVYEPRPGWPS